MRNSPNLPDDHRIRIDTDFFPLSVLSRLKPPETRYERENSKSTAVATGQPKSFIPNALIVAVRPDLMGT